MNEQKQKLQDMEMLKRTILYCADLIRDGMNLCSGCGVAENADETMEIIQIMERATSLIGELYRKNTFLTVGRTLELENATDN